MATTNIFTNPLTQGQSIFTPPTTITPAQAIQLGKGPIKITPTTTDAEISSWKRYTQPITTKDIRKTTTMPDILTVGKDVITNIYEKAPKIPSFFTTKPITIEQPKLTDPKAIQLVESFKASGQTGGKWVGPEPTQLFAPRTPVYGETVFPTYPKTPEERFEQNLAKYETDIERLGQKKETFKQRVASGLGMPYMTPEEQKKSVENYNRFATDFNKQNKLFLEEQQKYATDKQAYEEFLKKEGKATTTGKYELPTEKYATAETMFKTLSTKEKDLTSRADELRKQSLELEKYKDVISQAGTGSGWKNVLVDVITTPTLMLGQLPEGLGLSARKVGLLAEGAMLPTTKYGDIVETFSPVAFDIEQKKGLLGISTPQAIPRITETGKQIPGGMFQILSPVQKDPRTGKYAFNVEGAINLALATSAVESIGSARAAARAVTPQVDTVRPQYADILTKGNKQVFKETGFFMDKTGTTYSWLDKALGRTPGQVKQYDITATVPKGGTTGTYVTTITDPFAGGKVLATTKGTLQTTAYMGLADRITGIRDFLQKTVSRREGSPFSITERRVGQIKTTPKYEILGETKAPKFDFTGGTGGTGGYGMTAGQREVVGGISDVGMKYKQYISKIGGTSKGYYALERTDIVPRYDVGNILQRNIQLEPVEPFTTQLPGSLRTIEFKPFSVYQPSFLEKFGKVTEAMIRSKKGSIPISGTFTGGDLISVPQPLTISASAGALPPTFAGTLAAPGGIAGAELALINMPTLLGGLAKPDTISGVTSVTDITPFLGTLSEPLGISKVEVTPVTEVTPDIGTETGVETVPETITRTITNVINAPIPPTPITGVMGGLVTGAGLSAAWPFLGSLGGGPGEARPTGPRGVVAGVNVNYLRNFFFDKVRSETSRFNPSEDLRFKLKITKGKETVAKSGVIDKRAEVIFSELGTSSKVSGGKNIMKDLLSRSRIASNSAPFSKKLSLMVKHKKRTGNMPGIINYEGRKSNPLGHFL